MKFSSIPLPQRGEIHIDIALFNAPNPETNEPQDYAKFMARIVCKDVHGRDVQIKTSSDELISAQDAENGNPLLHTLALTHWIQASLIREMLGPATFIENP